MAKPLWNFFAMDFLLLFALLGLILIIFDLKGLGFVIELIILLSFIFLSTLGMILVYKNKEVGWTIISTVIVLMLIDTFFIFIFTNKFGTAHATSVLFSFIGLGISIYSLVTHEPEKNLEKEYEKAQAYYPFIDKMEPKEEQPKIQIESKNPRKKRNNA